MKKLSLDDLRVESYASQVSENELAEIKGGTAWLCFDAAIAVVTVGLAIYDSFKNGTGSSGGTHTDSSGGGTYYYGVKADSIKVTRPDGYEQTVYGAEIDSLRVRN